MLSFSGIGALWEHMMSRFGVLGAAALIVALLGGGGQAADMAGAPFGGQQEMTLPQSEFGTGWYLRGSVGYAKDQTPQLSADVAAGLRNFGVNGELGVGYQINNWFRMDATVGFKKAVNINQVGAIVTCPYALTGLSDPAGVQLGYLWDPARETCAPNQAAKLSQTNYMVNGYVDLGSWSGVTPYIGAGVGLASLRSQTKLNYLKTSDGSVYQADLTPIGTFPHLWLDSFGRLINPQPGVAFAKQNWSRLVSKTTSNFAFAFMGGVAINVADHTKLDIGYRYLSSGNYTSLPSPITGNATTSRITSQEVKVGLRYQID